MPSFIKTCAGREGRLKAYKIGMLCQDGQPDLPLHTANTDRINCDINKNT